VEFDFVSNCHIFISPLDFFILFGIIFLHVIYAPFYFRDESTPKRLFFQWIPALDSTLVSAKRPSAFAGMTEGHLNENELFGVDSEIK